MTDEEYVRSKWEDVVIVVVGVAIGMFQGYGVILGEIELKPQPTEAEAWAAAKAYTVERERQIAEVKEEIKEISHAITEWKDDGDDDTYQSLVYKRILSLRLQPVLDALKQGMKQ